MSEKAHPDEAARALAQIRDRQEQVINVTVVPAWYWWLVGGLIVALPAAIESREPVTIGIGVTVFVLGILGGTGWVVRGALHVQPRNELLGGRGVMIILGFVALVLGITLAVAFGLEAALLFGGMWLCLRGRLARSLATMAFGVLMLGIQAYVFFGPPPTSDRAAASTALIAYAVFAAAIWWLQDRRAAIGAR